MIDEVSVPASISADLQNETDAAPDTVTLDQRCGHLTGRAVKHISTRAVDNTLAAVVNVARGAPLLIFDRVVFDLDRLSLEWRLGLPPS